MVAWYEGSDSPHWNITMLGTLSKHRKANSQPNAMKDSRAGHQCKVLLHGGRRQVDSNGVEADLLKYHGCHSVYALSHSGKCDTRFMNRRQSVGVLTLTKSHRWTHMPWGT